MSTVPVALSVRLSTSSSLDTFLFLYAFIYWASKSATSWAAAWSSSLSFPRDKNSLLNLVYAAFLVIILIFKTSNNTKITSQDRVILLTNSSDIEIPSFNGYSRSEVKKVLDLLSVKYHFEGYGYVYEQSISAGTKINKDTEITLKLKSRYVEDGKNE